jgi:hypothetical protein
VYARLDVLESWIDAELVTVGVTNVDVNAPLRAALASIVSGDPLRITVGPDELTVQTLDAQVVEERVPLSDRLALPSSTQTRPHDSSEASPPQPRRTQRCGSQRAPLPGSAVAHLPVRFASVVPTASGLSRLF